MLLLHVVNLNMTDVACLDSFSINYPKQLIPRPSPCPTLPTVAILRNLVILSTSKLVRSVSSKYHIVHPAHHGYPSPVSFVTLAASDCGLGTATSSFSDTNTSMRRTAMLLLQTPLPDSTESPSCPPKTYPSTRNQRESIGRGR